MEENTQKELSRIMRLLRQSTTLRELEDIMDSIKNIDEDILVVSGMLDMIDAKWSAFVKPCKDKANAIMKTLENKKDLEVALTVLRWMPYNFLEEDTLDGVIFDNVRHLSFDPEPERKKREIDKKAEELYRDHILVSSPYVYDVSLGLSLYMKQKDHLDDEFFFNSIYESYYGIA